MYTIEPKRITTMTAVITLDQTEIAALIINPQPLINDLRSLHNAWQQPAPKDKPVKKKAPAKKAKPAPPADKIKAKLDCKYCGALFITPGRHANHEAKCIDNPANHKSAAEE